MTKNELLDAAIPQVGRMLREAEDLGIKIVRDSSDTKQKHISVWVYRRYDESEREAAPFLLATPVAGHFQLCDEEDKGLSVFKGHRTPSFPLFGIKDYPRRQMWMKNELIKKLKVKSWKGVKFLPALRGEVLHQVSFDLEWDCVKEVSSAVILPPVVHEVLRCGTSKGRGQGMGIIENLWYMRDQGFDDFQPRFYSDEIRTLPKWDIACSYERQHRPWRRQIYLSQRVYQKFKTLNLTDLCDWTPVVIEKASRPGNSEYTPVELEPPKAVWRLV
ncbi:MAG: hypothetical protein U0640_03600 [Phycisphaerales bacterium]